MAPYYRKKLKNKNFTIISNNCVGWGFYGKFGLKYQTPTIGIFWYPSDYIKFLENFEYYIKQPLKFTDTSWNPKANDARKERYFPTGLLGDVELQCFAYKTEKEALEKWNRRVPRINRDNLFVIFSDKYGGFKEEYLERYERLPFSHKIFLSSKPREGHSSVVYLRNNESELNVGELARFRYYERYIDVVKWLNGEEHFFRIK